jgi:hypothetical protein
VRATGPDGKGQPDGGAPAPASRCRWSRSRRGARSLSRFGEMESGGCSDSVFGLGDLILGNEN